jgi:hypothetical protein
MFCGRRDSARRALSKCADGTGGKELFEFYHLKEAESTEGPVLGY